MSTPDELYVVVIDESDLCAALDLAIDLLLDREAECEALRNRLAEADAKLSIIKDLVENGQDRTVFGLTDSIAVVIHG